MQTPLPFSNPHQLFRPAHYNFATTSSSSRSSTPSSPPPPSIPVLDQAFGPNNLYTIPFAYDAHMQHYVPQENPPFMHPNTLYSTSPYISEPEYQCIAPPELHFNLLPTQPSPQHHAEYQPILPVFPPRIDEHMLPDPSQTPSIELPKRKGERALARLQRSVSQKRNHPAPRTRY